MRATRLAQLVSGRAAGVRLGYAAMPDLVRDWVDATLGSPVVGHRDMTGGFSPGCATRLRCADGRRAFVKAVSPELNVGTPALFRREVAALEQLGAHPLWASLLASYDGGPEGWVILLLEDVEGERPDLADDTVMDRLLTATDELGTVLRERGARLPPPPSELAGDDGPFFSDGPVDLPRVFAGWLTSYDAAPTHEGALPGWLADRYDEQRAAVAALGAQGRDQPVHHDVRDDNVIQRADGSLVFVDWGAFGWGPPWIDPLLARLERVESPWFDASVSRSPALAAAGHALVTAWLVGMGVHMAVRARTASDVNLPSLAAFRLRESDRFLAGAARRLGLA